MLLYKEKRKKDENYDDLDEQDEEPERTFDF
jgi:hypothetical protein